MTFQYFCCNLTHQVLHLYILPKHERPALKRPAFWDKTGIFLKKNPWCMKIHLKFHFFAIWSISAYILFTIAWKASRSSWSPSELTSISLQKIILCLCDDFVANLVKSFKVQNFSYRDGKFKLNISDDPLIMINKTSLNEYKELAFSSYFDWYL